MPVRNGHRVLNRLVLCILDMGLAYSVVLNGHFGHVYLLQVRKNDDEEYCYLLLKVIELKSWKLQNQINY